MDLILALVNTLTSKLQAPLCLHPILTNPIDSNYIICYRNPKLHLGGVDEKRSTTRVFREGRDTHALFINTNHFMHMLIHNKLSP